ncbi:MAG: hypothetical protein KDE00_12565 [Rhodobacteraceae bacterium]|nr:hypothetical protein [Paracoccaceae bacterium]
MSIRLTVRHLLAAAMIFGLGACSDGFRTAYETPVGASSWRVADVRVSVPDSLTVSEENILLPAADIVWQEEPKGDRRAQVDAIMTAAIKRGAAGARGPRPVVFDVTMTRFHALTMAAETRAPAGVHDVEFDLTVRDATSGAVVYGPKHVEASLPAMTGTQMALARMDGQTQKSQISAHVARTIAGFLGIGRDARYEFNSLGG